MTEIDSQKKAVLLSRFALEKKAYDLVLLDVREPDEIKLAHLEDARVVYSPMSQLARRGPGALPEPVRDTAAEIVAITASCFITALSRFDTVDRYTSIALVSRSR